MATPTGGIAAGQAQSLNVGEPRYQVTDLWTGLSTAAAPPPGARPSTLFTDPWEKDIEIVGLARRAVRCADVYLAGGAQAERRWALVGVDEVKRWPSSRQRSCVTVRPTTAPPVTPPGGLVHMLAM